ncbi:hypothetical protein [Thermicanus aegyptius]|uniref:hypothetical protein n=1 Tax=Thermicanus aegyptius TaxID=94009 RepID=UPI00048A9E84|nr:hypothetical protein [Thermicanus aegyptius]
MSSSLSVGISQLKVKVDSENKLVFVWMTESQKDSEEFVKLKQNANSKKFKIVTFISGDEDVRFGLEKLILENALQQHSVEPTWLVKL